MKDRARLHKPPVLFLDEPTRGLDPIAAREVREEIERLRQDGMTILLTTHLLEDADQLCQRVAFIVNGRIVANDTPRHLKMAHGKRWLVVTIGDPPTFPDECGGGTARGLLPAGPTALVGGRHQLPSATAD